MKFVAHSVIFLIIFVMCGVIGVTGSGLSLCKEVPISITNINNCVGTECKASFVFNDSLSLITKSSSCILLTVEKMVVGQINIALVEGYKTQQADVCYYSDDHIYDTIIKCCNSGQLFTCNNCPGFIPNEFSGCSSGKLATGNYWCGYTTFHTGAKRYKICHLQNPSQSTLTFTFLSSQGLLQSFSYGNSSQPFISDNLELVVSKLTTTDPIVNDNIIYDSANPTDFFYLPSTLVNRIDEFDYSKLGWFKTYPSQSVGFPNYPPMNYIYVSCEGVSTVSSTAIYNSAVLRANTNYIASNQGITLNDTDFNHLNLNNYPGVGYNYQPYYYLKDGIISTYYKSPSQVSFIGVTFDGQIVPSRYNTISGNISVKTNKGKIETFTNALAHCDFIYNSNGVSCSQVCLIRKSSTSISPYGFGIMNSCQFSQTSITQTTDFSVSALKWPDLQWASYSFNTNMTVSNKESNNLPTIKINSLNVEFDYQVKLKNFTINFKTDSIIPSISNCTQHDLQLSFDLVSLSYPGSVLVYFSDPSILSINPIVGLVSKTFTITMDKSRLNKQNLVIIAQNGDYQSSCALQLTSSNPDNIGVDTPTNTTNPTNNTTNQVVQTMLDNLGLGFASSYAYPLQVLLVVGVIGAIVLAIVIVIGIVIALVAWLSKKLRKNKKDKKKRRKHKYE